MPAKSEKQLKLIWAIRRKYGKRKNAPKKWKWVFGEEWGHLAKESHILNFNQFNEAMGTLSNDDVDLIEDLCLGFAGDWNLSFDGHVDKIGVLQKGYISIQKFDKFHIQFGIQLNGSFVMHYGMKQLFYQDLNKLIERIKKFGYEVTTITFDSNHSGYRTFNFQISHTDEKSEEIINK